MNKLKTLKLSDGWPPKDQNKEYTAETWNAAERYRVEQLGDTIEYKIGDYLEHDVVAALCRSTEYKVTIVPKGK